MALLPVAEALERLLAGADPAAAETVALHEAAGRVLAEPLLALRTQPPFAASAMDGYAVRATDVATAAGAPQSHRQRPLPDRPVCRHRRSRRGRAHLHRRTGAGRRRHHCHPGKRPPRRRDDDRGARKRRRRPATSGAAGLDFCRGQTSCCARPTARSGGAFAGRMRPTMPGLPVIRAAAGRDHRHRGRTACRPAACPAPTRSLRPTPTASPPSRRQAGADALDLGIAPDRLEAIEAAGREGHRGRRRRHRDAWRRIGRRSRPRAGGSDSGSGCNSDFWKIAMRPGKPLMFGTLGKMRVHRPARQSRRQPGLLAPVPASAAGAAWRPAPSPTRRRTRFSARDMPPTTAPGLCSGDRRRKRDRADRPRRSASGFLDAEDAWPMPIA